MSHSNLPKNAHVSTHPCLQAKLSQLRSAKTGSRDAQTLVHEIALMVGYEALGSGLKAQQDGTVRIYLFMCIHPGTWNHGTTYKITTIHDIDTYNTYNTPLSITIQAMLYRADRMTGRVAVGLQLYHNNHLPRPQLHITSPHPAQRPLHGPRSVLFAPHARAGSPPRPLP